jgi:hypothetical protein
MRLIVIGIISVFLFFPTYFLLHPLFGENVGAITAAVLMYIGFPIFFLKVWKDEWKGPVVKLFNYLIAILVLTCSIYFLYIAFTQGTDTINAFKFLAVYGSGAVYYLVFGRFHINLKSKKT